MYKDKKGSLRWLKKKGNFNMMGKNNASIIRSRAKNKSHPPPTQQTRRKRIMTQDEFIKRHKIFSLIHWTL